ncbi:uncharacterized protein TRIADDRAFT_17584, partial [Trichoplax adhaerens]
NISWATCNDFTIEKGKDQINEYIKTWQYESNWLYCIDFLKEDDHPYNKLYRYRVLWSIPTRRKPIPRATAAVYFTICLSEIKPKVSYDVIQYYP